MQDGAERGWGGGKPRLPHGKYFRVNIVWLVFGEKYFKVGASLGFLTVNILGKYFVVSICGDIL